jgi:hypothetical protein
MPPTTDQPLIRTERLLRRYRMGRETVEALRGVDLTARRAPASRPS